MRPRLALNSLIAKNDLTVLAFCFRSPSLECWSCKHVLPCLAEAGEWIQHPVHPIGEHAIT